jgi:hypothetical protein
MPTARTRRLLTAMVGVIGVLIFAGSASAAALTQTPFGCRASVLRATLLNNITAEPYIANNAETPCETASDGVNAAYVPTQPSATQSTLATAGPAGAFTDSAFDPSGATAPGAAAVASVEGVTIPTSAGDVYVAGPIQATAQYDCVNDQLVAHSQANLDLIYISGVAHQVPANKPATFALLGGYVAVNQTITTPNSLTVDLVHVYIPNLLNVVVGEAQVTQSKADPCAGTSGVAPVLEICPPGSVLEPAAQLCVIHYNGMTIVVSRPFRGPSGGTVYALQVARMKYPHSPCVYGAGPKFALIATAQGGRVEGTEYSDRILAVGNYERVAGIGGNDCLDGIGKTERLFDGNGKERIYSSLGHNRIAAGNGNDLIAAGRGNDTITAGNGTDRISGKGGNKHISVGIGHNHIYGGPGKNRIFDLGVHAKVSCGSSGHNVAFLRLKAIAYAKSHGCTRVVHLQ